MTINEAIKQVMVEQGVPLTASEAYHAIIKSNLYEFHTDNPINIVRNQIRRHCENLDFPSAAPTKHFKKIGENKYYLLDHPNRLKDNSHDNKKAKKISADKVSLKSTLNGLQTLHTHYISELKKKILFDLKSLSPSAFELFAKRLLEVYGFHETEVTQISGDGGIDGHGKLKVGLAYLDVAFQCKRWSKGNVQRPEIDKFRGAIQGDFEQGLFFTTTSFSEGAIGASIKKGAVPIVLVDGYAIVDLMIEKGFGVQAEFLSIPSYALDLALSNEESSIG